MASRSQPCGDVSSHAATSAEPSAPFDVCAIAEVATKAIYTHGFGFREVVGPYERDGKVYVTFASDGDTPCLRAIFWISPEELADWSPKAEGWSCD